MVKKTVTLFLPRLHNNFIPLIDGLHANGYVTWVYALRDSLNNKFHNLNYFVLSDSKSWLIFIASINKHLKINKPYFILVRNDSNFTFIIILILAKIYGINVLLYNQYSCKQPKIHQNMSNIIFNKLFRYKIISPVLNRFGQDSHESFESPNEYRNRLTKQLNNLNIKAKSNWVPFFSNELNVPKNTSYFCNYINICTISRFQPRKNIDKLIIKLSDFVEKNSNEFILNVIGETEEEDYIDYLRNLSLKLPNNLKINFHLNVSKKVVDNILATSHVFILLAQNEIASVSQTEAFIHGCKILTYFENGNLDFLPRTPHYRILYDFNEFEPLLHSILFKSDHEYDMSEYAEVYLDFFHSTKVSQIIKKFLKV